ncbi:MAG TPA: cupredoxin domain-containing protein [Xanthobacteraceae bacterium]|jgi:plastocyanin|nr:cupredoxin domain-containing protein [Xanthobacteraceae bacterium]
MISPGKLGSTFMPLVALAAVLLMPAGMVRADDTVTLSITIKDHKFDPPELHAPPGKPFSIHVKNLNTIVSEFESSDLHFEKIVTPGAEGTVFVRPQQPGTYGFYDDFHHDTKGTLVVP